jgi:hypothetical protein
MARLLLNVWGPDYCDISFAVVAMNPARARWWLETIRARIEDLQHVLKHDFYSLEIWDGEPEFLRSETYTDMFPESIMEEVEGNDLIELPDDIILEQTSLKPARMELVTAHAMDDGIMWSGREKHSDHEVETPRLSWDRIKAFAEISEPPGGNKGKLHCWWCGSRTEEVTLFSSIENECPECHRR